MDKTPVTEAVQAAPQVANKGARALKTTQAVRETAAQRRAREAIFEAERRKAELETAPLRMLQLMALVEPCATVRVFIDPGLPCPPGYTLRPDQLSVVSVVFDFQADAENRDEHWRKERDEGSVKLKLVASGWEYDQVRLAAESVFAQRKAIEDRRRLAQDTYDALSVEQREALGLKYRPS